MRSAPARFVRTMGIVLLTAALVLAAAACDGAAPPVAEPSVSDILAQPDAYFGEQVTVTAPVANNEREGAFFLGDDGLDSDALLVVNQTDTTVSVDEVVRVTGEVRELDVATFEEEGLFETGLAEQFEPFQGQPTIIAETIETDVETEK